MLPVTSGRIAVRRIFASLSRSMISFIAAVPPETSPIPSSAWNSVQLTSGNTDLAAPKNAPVHAVITMSVVTRALVSSE